MSAPFQRVVEPSAPHRPFTVVLSGGGARGFAHVGVLRALEVYGFRAGAVVGVSMGAVVAATYSLRAADWYSALLGMDTREFPRPFRSRDAQEVPLRKRFRRLLASLRVAREMFWGWGVGTRSLTAGTKLLRGLTEGKRLEDGKIPVAVCATDLRTGERVVLASGSASQAAYASSALAGVLPPLRRDGQLLCDGAYSDIAPIDVARSFGHRMVIAVDAGQPQPITEIRNGFQALTRAIDICQLTHAHLRFEQADLVLRPRFGRAIDTLDFDARRECVAAGMRAVRHVRRELERLLERENGRSGDARPHTRLERRVFRDGNDASRRTKE